MLVSQVTVNQHMQRAYLEDLHAGHWDSVVTLILSFLTNLEELEILYWAGPDVLLRSYIEEVSRIQAGEQSSLNKSNSLPRLEMVKLSFDSYDEPEGSMSWEAVTVWSALSTVRELNALCVREDYEEEDSERFPDSVVYSTCFNRPSNVERLEISAAISATTLSDFLVRCPRLKHFDYNHENVFDHSDASSDGDDFRRAALFEPPRVRRALLQVRDTLEYLRIEPGLTDFNTDFSILPFGSLRDFLRLKSVRIEYWTLINPCQSISIRPGLKHRLDKAELENAYPKYISLIDTLPPNIQRLELSECYEDSMSKLLQLAHNLRNFPKLQIIVIHPDDLKITRWLERRGVKQLFENGGIKLE